MLGRDEQPIRGRHEGGENLSKIFQEFFLVVCLTCPLVFFTKFRGGTIGEKSCWGRLSRGLVDFWRKANLQDFVQGDLFVSAEKKGTPLCLTRSNLYVTIGKTDYPDLDVSFLLCNFLCKLL